MKNNDYASCLQSWGMFNGIVNYEKQRPLRDYMKRSEDKLNTMGGEYLNVPYFFKSYL